MPPGTLLYRTSSDGKMFGYSDDPLIYAEKGIIKDINSGHVAIYIGSENGQDYIVEALGSGIVKTPAEDFINLANGEKFLGAKIPKDANNLQIAKVVAIAKSLVGKKLGYDFDFKHQKGPGDGQWTCVGLAEKLYESANIANPNNLGALEYDPNYYAVNITLDGFDNYSVVDDQGDCFSKDKEFSKIAPRSDLLIPAPELIGFDAGLEYQGDRYIFLPYTQFLQPSLQSVAIDIPISSSFRDSDIRGSLPVKSLVLRWSLINNPISSVKKIAKATADLFSKTMTAAGTSLAKLKEAVLGSNTLAEVDLSNPNIFPPTKTNNSSETKAKLVAKTVNSKAAALPAIRVNKAKPKTRVTANNSKNSSISINKNRSVSNKNVKTNNSKSDAKVNTENNDVNIKVKTEKTALSSSTSSTKSAPVKQAPATTVVTRTVYYPQVVNTPAPPPAPSPADDWPKLAKINRIYARANDDFVELINTTDHDFDLAEVGYRLEKAKTAEDPSIIIRIGNSKDGSYPGGTVIKAHGTYLIVSSQANDYYRDQADAIATRDDFSWSGSGYTLYLGTAAITSSQDSDLVDAVGFGDATYFLGTQAAPEITEDYILTRLSYQDDNGSDFSLIASQDPDVIAELAAAAQAAKLTSSTKATSTDDLATTTDDSIATTTDNIATSTDETVVTTTDNIATSTDDIATTTNDIATTTDNIDTGEMDLASSTKATSTDDLVTSTDEIVATTTDDMATSTDETVATTTVDIATSTDNLIVTAPPIFINKIYSTASNDWIELFNPNDYDLDLASSSYRLEKTKTAEAPALIMRIGDPDDGVYPGGTVIKTHGVYTIVRNDADAYYLGKADAIALRDEFTWSGSGYSFYLASGAVSSNYDQDIKDLVGIGYDSLYFQGDGPAPAISDNYILNRLSYTGNNAVDFNLTMSDDPGIISGLPDSNSELYTFPVPLESPGITALWHFSECYGPGNWTVGRWDCARELSYDYEPFTSFLENPIDLNNFALTFQYRADSQFPRVILKLDDQATTTNPMVLTLDPGMITVDGLPVSQGRYYLPEAVFDNTWHQLSLTINQPNDYWAVYIDGQEVIKQTFFSNLWSADSIEIFDTNGPAAVDELALWDRAFTPEEILNNYLSGAPYAPLDFRDQPTPAQLVYSWDFQEDTGLAAVDSVSSTTLNVDPDAWIGRSHNNYALALFDQRSYSFNFPQPLQSSDLSLAFWWRNESSPNEGRSSIYLKGGEDGQKNILALTASDYRLSYIFNDYYSIFAEGLDRGVPNDGLWHHLALVYDSYRYKLNFYLDGELAASSSLIRLRDGEMVKSLQINDDNFNTAIDDFKVYAGALTPSQVKQLYLDDQ